ncbi:MAG: rRNA maturation RNase YbeY [Acidobacteriaceae bacterium]
MITIEPPSRQAAAGGPSYGVLRKTELRRFLVRASEAIGLKGEVHVLLSDDAALRRLNKVFRKKDKATDVLSFPAAEGFADIAGDLAISLETAARQAAEHGHSLKEEVRILLLHGLLHLSGYDHETDAGEMAAEEARLRSELGLPTGLIERAVARPASAKLSSERPPPARRTSASERATPARKAVAAKLPAKLPAKTPAKTTLAKTPAKATRSER